jgi:general secretion pathway protein D
MPFVCKITDFIKKRPVLAEGGQMIPLTQRCPSRRAGHRGTFYKSSNSTHRLYALIFTVFAVIVFLSPETGQTARLAGEDQPVPTMPSQPVDRKDASAKTATTQPVPGSAQQSVVAMPLPSQAPVQGSAETSQVKAAGSVLPPLLQQPQSQPALTPQPPQPRQSTAASQAGRYVTIDFDNVDIQVFIKFVSELTGRNFLLDERVKGKVTVISPRKIAVEEVYNVLESVLEIYGFTTVQAGEVTKVIPSVDARGKNMELRLKRESISPEDKLVTQIFSLQHASSDEMKKVLDPLISKTSVILSYPPTGMLIITDTLSNIKRLQDIVTALDVEGAGDEISYIPLQAALAAEIVKALTAVFAPQRAGIASIRLVADNRTNSVILLARQQTTVHVKKLISLMDKEVPQSASILNVYRLQNGNAEDLVKVLMDIPRDSKDTKAPTAPTAGKTPVLSKDVSVVADKATNTLIITADRDDYRTIEGVIRQLDVPRPMVYIEALIMEVSVNKNFNIGVEWRGLKDVGNASLQGLGSSATGLGMVGFTGQSIIPQANSTTGAVSMPAGFSLGVIGAGIQIGDILFPNIGAVLQAYQKDSDVSILSTPQLLTLNNEEAEINVGKNVPYITRSDVATPGVSSTVYGSSYEYKDVGVILKITPNINEEQFVRLKINQEVTKLTGEQTSTPTTLKRTAKTTVVVKDNETVVIGGLIDDSSSVDTYQVPCLGDIPLLGWLFKSMVKGREKSNLFIFITPHIVRNQDEAAAIYKKKLDDVGNVEEGVIRMDLKKTLTKPSKDWKE